MSHRTIVSISAIIALGFALSGSALAQQKSLKDQIVGTWTFVSALDIKPDGTKNDRWGSNPKGIFIFDNTGHFAQFIMRSDLPKFAGKTTADGTAAEYKAVMQGMVGSFGTYTVNENEKTVTTRVDGSAFPNLNGVNQVRKIVSLTADELKYTNPATSTGATAEATWKRAK